MIPDNSARSLPPASGERVLPVLVVEDESPIRAALVDYLEECGFCVLEAACATAAIQLILYGDKAVSGVVTDICMPGEMDGLGLLSWIQHNHADLPVIVTSGRPPPEVASALGPKACFLRKPYEYGAVAAKLEELTA